MGQDGMLMPTSEIMSSSHSGRSRSSTIFPERRKSTCSLAQENFVSCISDGEQQGAGNSDPSHGRLSDFLRQLKCAGYGKVFIYTSCLVPLRLLL